MTLTAVDLQKYVGDTHLRDTDFAQACLDQATELVDTYVGDAEIPDAILERAYLEVGSELFHRKNSPSGVQAQYADLGTQAPRLARDPMTGTYPLLARYVGGGIG